MAAAVGMLCGCYSKAYTDKEEKDQISEAIAAARQYSDENNSSITLKENTFTVMDHIPDGEHLLHLSDWVKGEYTDSGRFRMMVNTRTGDIYSDRDWISVGTYGEKLLTDLYGLDEDSMCAAIGGTLELPLDAGDPGAGNMTIVDMMPIGSGDDEQAVRDVFFGGVYDVTYYIVVNEDVDMEMFRELDTDTLGANARVIVSKYSADVYRDKQYNPDRRSYRTEEEAAALIDEYDSAGADTEED